MNNPENFDEGLTKTNLPKYFIYVCSKCKGQVSEERMGQDCPHCHNQLYEYLSKQEAVLVSKEVIKND